MSWRPTLPSDDDVLERVLDAQTRDLGGGFTVGRVLPAALRRTVGPFVFFDHMGPHRLVVGEGMDVRPHPHINLATVTYLFSGAIHHRDTLGSSLDIRPGAINWMTAGRGIAHSERTPPELRQTGSEAHGLQLWVGLPSASEEVEPAFDHYPSESLPELTDRDVRVRVLAGHAFGATSPVRTLSPLFYLDVELGQGATLPLPDEGYHDRALYLVSGAVQVGGERATPRHMLVFKAGSTPTIVAREPSRFVVLGGEPLDGPRHLWWNFVSSSKDRIEQAKADWQAGRFGTIAGDEREFIPLPV